MRPKSAALVLSWLAALAGTCAAQSGDEGHRKIYSRTVDSVVALRALAPLGERSGTGVVLSKDGLILTSYACCPEASTKIRVWVHGPRLYEGELLGTSKLDEISIVKIKPKAELKPIEFGDSSRVRVGEVSYTIGNAANSIILDDQPSLNMGIVSAIYRLNEERANSWYVGPVLETTAAVNVGMEGAPCVNASGQMVGLVTLNYSPHRFLGAAIPIDDLKPVIRRLKDAKKAETEEASTPAGEGYLGMKVKVQGGKVVVEEVEKDGPADRAGFEKGIVILEVADAKVKSPADVTERLKGLEAGSVVWIKAFVEGKIETLKVTLEKKK